MDISAISVSRYQVWNECARRYLYQYHLKLKPPEEKFHFTYGKIVHRVAEKFVACRGEVPITEWRQRILSGEVPLEEPQPGVAEKDQPKPAPIELSPADHERLSINLANVQWLVEKVGFGGVVEVPFQFDLDPPNNKIVRGVIDLIVGDNNMYSIVDYKTTKPGKWRETPESIRHNLQLRIYARFLNKKHGIPADRMQAALYYVDDRVLVPTRFTQEAIEEAEQILLNAYDEIVEMPPEHAAGRTGFHCQRCDWKNICPYAKVAGFS